MTTANVGLIGLAVMGQNLVLNMERNGYTVAVYNRTTAVTDEFVGAHPGKQLVPARTLEEFVASLERPRRDPDHGQGRRRGGCGDRRPVSRCSTRAT